MNTIKLQDAVPRPQSLAYQLSCSAWQDGIYSFYRNAVPFSYTTGHEYAQQLVLAYIEICKHCPQTTYHVYELGAGTGLLSKHFLDLLNEMDPTLYSKTTVHITDESTDLISELQSHNFFKKHPNIVIETMNCIQPNFTEPATLILCNNLIDSTNVHHFELHNGTLYELYVETSIPENTALIHAPSLPGHILSATDINKQIHDTDTAIQYTLRSKLGPLLNETYIRTPLDKTTLTHPQKEIVQNLIAEHNISTDTVFNVHFEMLDAVNTYADALADSGVISCCDFGYTDITAPRTLDNLVKRYGVHCFSAVWFDLFKRTHPSITDTYLTDFGPGNTQTLLLYKGKQGDAIKNSSKVGFRSTKKLEDIVDHLCNDNPTIDDIQNTMRSLDILEQKNHSILCVLTMALLSHQSYTAAQTLIDLCLNLYGDLSISGLLLKGNTELALGKSDSAKRYYERALDNSQNQSYSAYLGLASIAQQHGQHETLIQNLEQYLKHCPTVNYMEGLLSLSEAYINNKQANNAKQLLQWIAHTQENYPSLVSSDVLATVHKQLATL